MSGRYVNKLEIDFYKELELPKTTCGLVNKILSPKGIRVLNDNNMYEYRLKDELVQIYDNKPVIVDEGIYWVMDIYKNSNGVIKWNHYLVIVEKDCFYPIAEFLDCKDSTWIKHAIHFIKSYFNGEIQDPIELTRYVIAPKKKTRWHTGK